MHHHSSGFRPLRLTLFSLLILLVLVGVWNTTIIASAQEKVVAVVNSRKITQDEVDKSVAVQLAPLQQQIYALRKAALDNIVLKAILEEEARKRGISVEELKRAFTTAKVEVKQSDIEQVYAENRQAFGAMSEDEAKERIRLDLESQARMQNYHNELSKLEQSYHVQLNLEEPALPTVKVAEENAPSLGSKEAAVTIIEFSDFQCPFCRGSQSTLKKVLQTYGNSVRLVFKNLPLEMHSQAFSSARAAFCAGEQNRFWQYHDALFTAESLSPEGFNKIAANLGLDIPRFKSCLDSEISSDAVLKDVEEAKRLGIAATPTFIINGTPARGALSFENFSDIIARKLKDSQIKLSQR